MEKIFIQQLSNAAGLAPSALATAAKLNPSTLNRRTKDKVEVTHKLSFPSLAKIAKFLNMEPAQLVAYRAALEKAIQENADIPSFSISAVKQTDPALQYKESMRNADFSLQSGVVGAIGENPFGPDTVPVLGNANGSSEAIMLNFDEPIGVLPRHPNQVGMKGAFALYARGESMYPRYMPSDPVFAIANRPPARGQDCIIEMNNGEGFLKCYVRQTDKFLVCKQYNPDIEWKRPLSDIKAIHAVIGRG